MRIQEEKPQALYETNSVTDIEISTSPHTLLLERKKSFALLARPSPDQRYDRRRQSVLFLHPQHNLLRHFCVQRGVAAVDQRLHPDPGRP